MKIVKNLSLTDRIGGSIMYENDNFPVTKPEMKIQPVHSAE